jgi:hypothetical protein
MADSNKGKLRQPLSYIDWVSTMGPSVSEESDLFVEYNAYVRAFYKSKNIEGITDQQQIENVYKDLLREITLNYSSAEEQRYLSNINYDDKSELDVIVPYFATKLKNITQYFVSKRQEVKFANIKHSFKGSELGIKKVVKDTIVSLFSDSDFTEKYPTSIMPSSSAIANNITVEIVSLYDSYQNYYDIDSKTNKDVYATNVGYKNHYDNFDSNVQDTNANAFLDLKAAIESIFDEIPLLLATACSKEISDNSSLNIELNQKRSDISELPYKYFVNSTKTADNLFLEYENQLVEKYAGTKMYYLSTGTTATTFVSGVLHESKNPTANILNRYYSSHATVPNLNHLKVLKDIGGFSVPTKLGILNYSTVSHTYVIDKAKLASNTVYVFPDPNVYGVGRGNTKTDQLSGISPVVHTDDIRGIKASRSNSKLQGDIVNAAAVQKLYPYQSREETLRMHPGGISRSTDKLDFWTGGEKDIWANEDVYPAISQQALPVQNKLQDLLISNSAVCQWKTDIYGNEYALYKPISPSRQTSEQQLSNFTTSAIQNTSPTQTSGLYTTPKVDYYDHQLSSKTTVFENKISDITTQRSIFDKRNAYGNLYFRNIYSDVIGPVSSTLSGVFIKYTEHTDIYDEINSQVQDFDIIDDVILIKTTNFIVIEQLNYDASTSVFTSKLGKRIFISLSGTNTSFEKFANTWYDSDEKVIYLTKSVLHPYLSGSNYKLIYPQIYKYDMERKVLAELYSLNTLMSAAKTETHETTYSTLSTEGYSLSGSGNEINLVSIDQPSVCFNKYDNTATVTFLGNDPGNHKYIVVSYFDTTIKAAFSTKQVLFFKPAQNIINYHVDTFVADTISPSISSMIEGTLGRGNVKHVGYIAVDGLTSEVNIGGDTDPLMFGATTSPTISGRLGPVVARTIDSVRNTTLLGQGLSSWAGTFTNGTAVAPYTHNSSYIIYNLPLDPVNGNITIYTDIALYTNTTSNSAYATTLTNATFDPVLSSFGDTEAPGDGVCVFFFDPDYEFFPAGIGSSLGYTNYSGSLGYNHSPLSGDINGMRGAYLGVGLDVRGGFSTTRDGKTGTTAISANLAGVDNIVKTTRNDDLAPNTVTVRSSELSSYTVLSNTSNLSTYPITDIEKYAKSPAVNLHQSVSGVDDVIFHKIKISLHNKGKTVRVDILNAADGLFYPYQILDLGQVAVPSKLKVGLGFSTSHAFMNCEVKNFAVYGTTIDYAKDNAFLRPPTATTLSVSAIP